MAVSLKFVLHKSPAPQVDARIKAKHAKAPIPSVSAAEYVVIRDTHAQNLPFNVAKRMRLGRYKVR